MRELTDTERQLIYEYQNTGKPAGEISMRYDVSLSTIYRIWSGKVSKKKRGGAVIRILGQPQSNLLYNELIKNPQIKGHELQSKLESELNTKVSVSSINRHLRSSAMNAHGFPEFTVKRIRQIQVQRNSPQVKQERKDFIKQYKIESAKGEEFIFIDEVPLKLGSQFSWGRSPIGTVCVKKTSRIIETTITAIVAVNHFIGVVNCIFVKGGVNTNTFVIFLLQTIRKLQINTITSGSNFTLVMDNVNLHNEEEINRAIVNTNFKLLKTARYSPELHCIEYIFGIWKSRIRIPSDVKEIDAILRIFQNSLSSINSSIVRSCKLFVETVVFKMVHDDVDLQLTNCSERFKEVLEFPPEPEIPDTVPIVDAGDVNEVIDVEQMIIETPNTEVEGGDMEIEL